MYWDIKDSDMTLMFLTRTVTRKAVIVVTMSSALLSDHDSENSTVLTRAMSSNIPATTFLVFLTNPVT